MKLIKDPLIHFLLIGAALFLLFELTGDRGAAPSETRIVVGPGRIEQLSSIFAKTWQRRPSASELEGLINDFVLEEIYYREGRKMGLDENDTMIRRRLRQKLEFLTDDAIATEPTDEELAAYLEKNADSFRLAPRFTFEQLYFNPEKHGDDPAAAVREIAEALRSGEPRDGDTTLLPPRLEDASASEVDATFGRGFSGTVGNLAPGEWSDPLWSGLGLHLVRLESLTPGRVPELDEVRPAVRREWENARRTEMRERFDEELKSRYEVSIEWPGEESAPPPPGESTGTSPGAAAPEPE